MSRPLRLEYSGACYHVINRGNYRRRIFEHKGAAAAFERTLDEAAVRFIWRIHAYVIMGNHFHLALELTEPNLSDGMKWLQGTWVRRFNQYRDWSGRPFQGRYKGILVEPGQVLAQVCHYIHLNPVRAGLVEPENVGNYRWTSLHWYGKRNRPGWLLETTILQESGGLRDSQAGWEKYREYLQFLATDDQHKRELAADKLSRGWVLGSSEFKEAKRTEARERVASFDKKRFEGLDRDEIRIEREAYWEDMLRQMAGCAGIDLESLPLRKTDPQKSFLAAAMKTYTSVANGWLAQRLEMGQPATSSQCARRWMLDKSGKRAVEKLRDEISKPVQSR